MRTYIINGKEGVLKTKPSEITLKEFQAIASKPNEGYEYYLDAFEILGFSKEFADEISAEDLFGMIKDFTEDFGDIERGEFQREIEVDGFLYHSYEEGEKFVLSARTLAKIEKKFDSEWLAYAMALIFHRGDLSEKDETDAHIKYKAQLFGSLTLDIVLPYIYSISETYVENISLLHV